MVILVEIAMFHLLFLQFVLGILDISSTYQIFPMFSQLQRSFSYLLISTNHLDVNVVCIPVIYSTCKQP